MDRTKNELEAMADRLLIFCKTHAHKDEPDLSMLADVGWVFNCKVRISLDPLESDVLDGGQANG